MADFNLIRDHLPSISYTWEKGTKNQAIVYLHGWTSHRKSLKGEMLSLTARMENCHYVSLDYTGHGVSGGSLADFTIGRALTDILDVMQATIGDMPVWIVGSSIGGWLGLLLAERLKSQALGYIGLAPAADMTYDIWHDLLPDYARQALEKGDILGPSPETQGFCFTPDLFADGEKHFVLNRSLELPMPVRVFWGDKDHVIHLKKIMALKDALVMNDAIFYLIKGADHHLSEARDLNLIQKTILELIKGITK